LFLSFTITKVSVFIKFPNKFNFLLQIKIIIKLLLEFLAQKLKRLIEAQKIHQYIKLLMMTSCRKVKYIMKAAEVYCELRPKEIRIFAYELTQKYTSTMLLCQWKISKIASKDWFSNCMRRHSTIIVYSMSRAHQSISCH
jgi:hypothetical protein